MDEKKTELSMEQLEQANGGVYHTVNTGIEGVDAALRADASKGSKQIDHIPNGTVIDTITDQLYYDPVSNRHFVQVVYNGKVGYIASSIVGLRR